MHKHIRQPPPLFLRSVSAQACCNIIYFCLVFFCTEVHQYKAGVCVGLLASLAAILEGALESRVTKLTKLQDKICVSACSDNHTMSVSVCRSTQSNASLVLVCWPHNYMPALDSTMLLPFLLALPVQTEILQLAQALCQTINAYSKANLVG